MLNTEILAKSMKVTPPREILEAQLSALINESHDGDQNSELKVAFSFVDSWRIVIFRKYLLYRGEAKRGHGRLASIGASVDYHTALYAHLEVVVSYLELYFGPQPRSFYVDKDGGDDRAWAFASGKCAFGKNHLIIHEDLGSAINIGSASVNLPAEICELWRGSDKQRMESLCGNCAQCISMCPTSALDNRNALNLERCRSAINQKKGIIDAKERELLEDWIYGCDICLWACPHNDKNRSAEGLYISSDDVAGLSNKSFKVRFASRAFTYLGLSRIKRNIEAMEIWWKR